MRMVRRGLIVFCCILLFCSGISGLAIADSDTDLAVENAVETPSETVEFEGDEYEIDEIAVYEPGATMAVDVTLPDNERDVFDLLLYNSDQNIERSERTRDPSASESVSFETDGAPPGTYSLNLEVEGTLEKVYPIVLSGYDVSIEAPDTAAVGEEIEVEVTVTQTELDTDPAGVEVVLWNDARTERIDATANGDGTYTASVSLDNFAQTDYNLYATALGEDTFEGEPEILGIEDGDTLTVTNDTEDTGEQTDEEESTGGGGGGGGGGVGTSPSDDNTTASDDNTTSESDQSDTNDDSSTDPDGTDGTDTADGDSGEQTGSDTDADGSSDEIITPSNDTDTEESPSVEEQPLHPGVVVVAIGVFLLAQRRRR